MTENIIPVVLHLLPDLGVRDANLLSEARSIGMIDILQLVQSLSELFAGLFLEFFLELL